MIADLLDLTRTRLGGVIPLQAVHIDLQRVCEEVVLEVQASHLDAVVHYESHGDVTGKWDADRLAQVVSNLVGNAIEHGGKTPVTLVASAADERVKLTVHNNGDPIPPHAQAKIFEPLARGTSDGTRNFGLGLYRTRHCRRAWGRDPCDLQPNNQEQRSKSRCRGRPCTFAMATADNLRASSLSEGWRPHDFTKCLGAVESDRHVGHALAISWFCSREHIVNECHAYQWRLASILSAVDVATCLD